MKKNLNKKIALEVKGTLAGSSSSESEELSSLLLSFFFGVALAATAAFGVVAAAAFGVVAAAAFASVNESHKINID